MFLEQRPKDSKVVVVIMTTEEADHVWTALANSVHKNPTSEKLRRLLWGKMNSRPEMILKGKMETIKKIDSRRSIVRFVRFDPDNAA